MSEVLKPPAGGERSWTKSALASLALKPVAHLWLAQLPPPPDPRTALAVRLGLMTLTRVMGCAKTQSQRGGFARVILESGGFDGVDAEDSAARMYPG